MNQTKYWDGFERHPFLERLSSELATRRFRSLGFINDGTGSYEWSKPAFEGYDYRVMVMPEVAEKERISLTVGLSIESTRQAEVESQIGVLRCRENPVSRKSVSILYVSLQWLMMRWEPIAGAGTEVFARWKDVPSAHHETFVSDVLQFFDQQGILFFELVSTPQKLADVLQNLQGFPGRGTLPSGPLSSRPLEFAAVLLNDLGRPSDALGCLRRDMESASNKVADGVWHEQDLRIAECTHRRYTEWIGGVAH